MIRISGYGCYIQVFGFGRGTNPLYTCYVQLKGHGTTVEDVYNHHFSRWYMSAHNEIPQKVGWLEQPLSPHVLRPRKNKFVYHFLYQIGVIKDRLVQHIALCRCTCVYVTCGCSVVGSEYESVIRLVLGGKYLRVAILFT